MVLWNEAAEEAVVAHEKINAAVFEEEQSLSFSISEVVEPYVPEEYTPTFVLDNVDYDPEIW